jgi:hypothetical protein
MSVTQNASQATQVEQARAIAEVLGSIEAAQRWPRDEELALKRFLSACSRPAFAERAFFRFRRGTEQVTGPTIGFAEEAARCWGNMTSGSSELVRRAAESEILARATDLETNYTRHALFVNPHVGYVDTPKELADGTWQQGRKMRSVRDIRENNQSAGSRVEREMILAVLPDWYIELGVARCYKTLEGDTETPIEDRRRALAEWFENTLSVHRDLLVAKLGVPLDRWLPADLANLRVIGQAIRRGEATVEAEFAEVTPAAARRASVTVDDLGTAPAAAAEPAQDEPPAQNEPAPDDGGKPARRTVNALLGRLGEIGLDGQGPDGRARRLRVLTTVTGERITSTSDLTVSQVDKATAWLDSGEATAAAVAVMLDDAEQPS